MISSAKNIQVTKFDDLFSAGNPAGAGGSGNVQEIPLTELFPFKDHPFKVLDDETMQDTVESIKIHGVLVPGIARPRAEGGYELIAGHRRRHASELAGKTTMPVIVRELEDDEAVLFMVDSNIQRENLFPSEKAWAYKMKLDALKHQGVKDTSRQLGEKYSVDALSENSNDSARNIHRFIRLTQLLPELLQMVDDKKLSFNPAVELSHLTREQQGELMEIMGELQAVPSLEQAKRLKKYSQVDGQHRISAMRKMNGGRGIMVDCKVYNGLTYEQEADLCYKLDKAKKRLSLSQSTNVLAESGADAEITEVKRLVENCGFIWALGKSHGKTGEIVSTRALVNAYRLLGGASFTRMLQLLWDTWKGDPRSLTAALLAGMALFVKTYDTELNDRTFISRLSQAGPDEINRRGRADFSTSNNALRFARVILEKYNGQRGGRKLPYRFRG